MLSEKNPGKRGGAGRDEVPLTDKLGATDSDVVESDPQDDADDISTKRSDELVGGDGHHDANVKTQAPKRSRRQVDRGAVLEQAAWGYAQLGWYSLPVLANKEPASELVPHGFKDASMDSDVLNRWFRTHPDLNIGVVVPAGYFVLDVDPRNGGDETFDDLQARHSKLPDTLTQRTGGGGLHCWFRLRPGQRPRKRLGAGLDIKKPEAGYVIVWPSRTSGNYEWLDCEFPELEYIAEAPEWLIESETTTGTTQPAISGAGMTAAEYADVIDALKHIPADDYTIWIMVGQALHHTGDARAFDVWDRWSQTCPEKYSPQETANKWLTFGK